MWWSSGKYVVYFDQQVLLYMGLESQNQLQDFQLFFHLFPLKQEKHAQRCKIHWKRGLLVYRCYCKTLEGTQSSWGKYGFLNLHKNLYSEFNKPKFILLPLIPPLIFYNFWMLNHLSLITFVCIKRVILLSVWIYS